MTLPEHLVWFVVMSLLVFVSYHALRIEDLRVAVWRGLRRWMTFVIGTAALGVVFHLLSTYL